MRLEHKVRINITDIAEGAKNIEKSTFSRIFSCGMGADVIL